MNSTCQTALQLGKEYSQRLVNASQAYEMLTGQHPGVDGEFWETREIQKLEVLSAFYWWLAKYNDPTFIGDDTAWMEDYDEQQD